jgi:hypothetical protein
VGVHTYNTYFMLINDYNLKAMNCLGIDIEAVWKGTQDGTWGPIHRELIAIAKSEGVTLGCPDFLTSRNTSNQLTPAVACPCPTLHIYRHGVEEALAGRGP